GRLPLGEFYLCVLRCIAQALHGIHVVFQVNALFLPELIDEIVGNELVEIVTAETVVACGGFDLEYSIAKREDGHIERASAKVVDKDGDIRFLVDTIRKSA